jgi:putative membrane-bound dehydrogenase-like protein
MKSIVIAGLAIFAAAETQLWAASGKQLSGQWAPAMTPALSPEEAQKKFTVPEGFEVRLFAAEPMVVNPVAMTWDERGRLWVVELYEYPLGAKEGEKPRDQVKILEDTDNDGRADKVTVFADGLNLATGIALGDGGAYVGQAPHLLFFKDTNGDDKADVKQIAMTGFGLEDRHELLNSFAWGPDGALHMTHGVFTFSKVKNPEAPNEPEVLMTAAVARFFPKSKRFEIVSEGTSNPWGVDWDAAGNAFVSACVIDHMFHMAPGGIYQRQAGNPPFPYAYELLPSIVDHKHHMAAYAGISVYQGDQFPEEYRGTVLMGNIHDSAVHQDRLTANGSTFKASFMKDFVRANDGWFRPVSTQVGPDGAVWIMDWYDKYPCYQNANADPEGVDRTRGRVWRVVHTGGKKGMAVPPHPQGMDLGKLSNDELARTLKHPNIWQRRTAQRLLTDRSRVGDVSGIRPILAELFAESETQATRMAAVWTSFSTGLMSQDEMDAVALANFPAARAWAARITGERGEQSEQVARRLYKLSTDSDPSVRVAVATAIRQYVSGSLTINTPPRTPLNAGALALILSSLIAQPGSGNDPVLPFMTWMALEPVIEKNAREVLGWFVGNGPEHPEMSAKLLYKIARRLSDTQQPTQVGLMLTFLEKVPKENPAILRAALDGLIEGQRGKVTLPEPTNDALAGLAKHPNADVAQRAQRLGAMWGDVSALKLALATLEDEKTPLEQRVATAQSLRQIKGTGETETALRATFLKLAGASDDRLAVEAIRAAGEVGGLDAPAALLGLWKKSSPARQRAIAEVLTSRREWTQEFLSAIEKKTLSASDLSAPVVRSLANNRDEAIRARAAAVIGRVRDADADKARLIAEKKRMVQQGQPDINAGREIARKTCFTCHKLYGEGAEVGPDLTGVGRSSLDALLVHVIDPNQIVGKGYENVEIELKDGRSVSGRIVEESDSRIKLISAGPKEEVVSKSDIASKRVSELSVMPEGLEQMPDADFRNLIWYILNPPQDKNESQPEPKKVSEVETKTDGESVALWNPAWKINAVGATKLPMHNGRPNVLITKPAPEQVPTIERTMAIAAGRETFLRIWAGAEKNATWNLRVFANDQLLKKETIETAGAAWQQVKIDLSRFAGKTIRLRLENTGDPAYWGGLEIEESTKLNASK